MYIIIGKADGYIEENNRNKYLIFASTYKNKDILEKYTELCDGIKNLIEKINEKPGKYEKDFMKIQENNKYYPHVFLDESLYEL